MAIPSILDENLVTRSSFLEEIPSSFTGVEAITVTNPGINFTSTPTIEIVGDGQGATAQAVVVNGQVKSVTITNGGTGYTQAIVTITSSDGNGTLASALAVLAGNYGTLRTFYYDNGVKTILNTNAGTIDYQNGIVKLDNFNPYQVNNPLGILTLQVIPNSTIISSSKDKIITLDNTDINAINVNITAKV